MDSEGVLKSHQRLKRIRLAGKDLLLQLFEVAL
jgi:hypothetical protein